MQGGGSDAFDVATDVGFGGLLGRLAVCSLSFNIPKASTRVSPRTSSNDLRSRLARRFSTALIASGVTVILSYSFKYVFRL